MLAGYTSSVQILVLFFSPTVLWLPLTGGVRWRPLFVSDFELGLSRQN